MLSLPEICPSLSSQRVDVGQLQSHSSPPVTGGGGESWPRTRADPGPAGSPWPERRVTAVQTLGHVVAGSPSSQCSRLYFPAILFSFSASSVPPSWSLHLHSHTLYPQISRCVFRFSSLVSWFYVVLSVDTAGTRSISILKYKRAPHGLRLQLRVPSGSRSAISPVFTCNSLPPGLSGTSWSTCSSQTRGERTFQNSNNKTMRSLVLSLCNN